MSLSCNGALGHLDVVTDGVNFSRALQTHRQFHDTRFFFPPRIKMITLCQQHSLGLNHISRAEPFQNLFECLLWGGERVRGGGGDGGVADLKAVEAWERRCCWEIIYYWLTWMSRGYVCVACDYTQHTQPQAVVFITRRHSGQQRCMFITDLSVALSCGWITVMLMRSHKKNLSLTLSPWKIYWKGRKYSCSSDNGFCNNKRKSISSIM